jgi:hypothetical protein
MEGVRGGCTWRVYVEGVDGGSRWRVYVEGVRGGCTYTESTQILSKPQSSLALLMALEIRTALSALPVGYPPNPLHSHPENLINHF